MIKSIKAKKNLIIYILAIVFSSSFILNCFQIREIKNKEIELERVSFNEAMVKKPLRNYYNIIKSLEDKEYIDIKKINNNEGDKNFISIDIEFEGNYTLLENFFETLKKDESFKKINFIKLKKKKEETFLGEISIDFNI